MVENQMVQEDEEERLRDRERDEAMLEATLEEEEGHIDEREDWGQTRDERHGTQADHKTMPPFLKYEGSRRPDGVWVQGLKWQDRNRLDFSPEEKAKMTVHFLEITVTSENYIRQANRAKKRQYDELIQACKDAGVKCQLHVIPVGGRGWPTWLAMDSFEALGIRPGARRQLTGRTSRESRKFALMIAHARRRIEQEPRYRDHSGQYRISELRRLKRKYGIGKSKPK